MEHSRSASLHCWGDASFIFSCISVKPQASKGKISCSAHLIKPPPSVLEALLVKRCFWQKTSHLYVFFQERFGGFCQERLDQMVLEVLSNLVFYDSVILVLPHPQSPLTSSCSLDLLLNLYLFSLIPVPCDPDGTLWFYTSPRSRRKEVPA